jgi:beta-galactosidase
MKQSVGLTFSLLGLLLLGATTQIAHADDGIFPPAPAAAPFINFDGRGFLLNGKRTFIASGGMEYCRIPRAL